jgi:hypothetical protein
LTEEEKTKFMNITSHEVILDCIENKGGEGERQRIRMDPIEVPDTDLSKKPVYYCKRVYFLMLES